MYQNRDEDKILQNEQTKTYPPIPIPICQHSTIFICSINERGYRLREIPVKS